MITSLLYINIATPAIRRLRLAIAKGRFCVIAASHAQNQKRCRRIA